LNLATSDDEGTKEDSNEDNGEGVEFGQPGNNDAGEAVSR
jgi:hypothetical protein